ncbi:MAG TPA: diguanylate cyclase, partial [Candidatus Limnocylindrales bacterium]|nr:diguanylate cyclase [Candidatus Limnocylindrales bacterium]
DRATVDRLTGVANRQSLLAALFAEAERASRYGRPLSVAFVDIDHFKAVNDTYGHAVGDIVLRGVAQAIAANLRTSDMIGRYGGEEFMLILTETNIEEGAALTEKLRTLVQRQRFAIEGAGDIAVTISIGIAGGSGSQLRMDTLVRDADAAMYSAKSLGRNQTYVFAEPDDDARVPRAPISAAGRARAMEIGQRARDASMAALTSVLDPLPHYRGQPSALIASIVVQLARQLQLSDAEIDRLRVAALLHDVGKIAVPEEILEKPSALTSAEWRTVVQHPRIGQVILEQAAALKDAVPIILHHHERYAGHGYPFGLRANEIPLGARIVAIADAYDAMTNDRPYKRAISHDQAITELRRHSGTQFDPELVDLFCDLYASRAPEPDATVLALSAADSAHHAAPLIVPDPAASRVQRKRRRLEPGTGDEAMGETLTMGPDGSIGIAPGRGQIAPVMPTTTAPARSRGSDSAAG